MVGRTLEISKWGTGAAHVRHHVLISRRANVHERYA